MTLICCGACVSLCVAYLFVKSDHLAHALLLAAYTILAFGWVFLRGG